MDFLDTTLIYAHRFARSMRFAIPLSHHCTLSRKTQVVCATLSACGSAPLVEAVSLTGKGFDTVIVDEACQVWFFSFLFWLGELYKCSHKLGTDLKNLWVTGGP